ncbi:uncharacterized protein LAESUDRAFT_456116 [Laetiporus sulphureus 93-53]|uniref:Uncharacterized protein n=1 Tax=Laetiporus sulphureus 93-53 TaxID=1314785 RepID=A0A165BTB1_9APHY|nr:uncharacterized protein LAESUDRAFT_456116 [Laetiporus sulphureus 93-53]KZT01609.1 hypothetical protein LAESUDRAFT_456116 [Laetiporus sulphureus 93-53]
MRFAVHIQILIFDPISTEHAHPDRVLLIDIPSQTLLQARPQPTLQDHCASSSPKLSESDRRYFVTFEAANLFDCGVSSAVCSRRALEPNQAGHNRHCRLPA